jgi:tetratricopeptide (TPR) repeat protein
MVFQQSYEKAVEMLEKRTNYETALIHINKCILLKPYHIPFYEIRSEIYLNLCDFQSSILSLQKGFSYKQATSNTQQSIDEQQPQTVPKRVASVSKQDKLTNDKIAFLRYISGLTLFDQKLYIDALSIIANGADVFSTFPFQIYRYLHFKYDYKCTILVFSVLCLTALNKMDEATALITQMIEEYPANADLLIIRARLYYKDKNKVFIKIFFFPLSTFTRKKEQQFFE